jgi:hypothetical protein
MADDGHEHGNGSAPFGAAANGHAATVGRRDDDAIVRVTSQRLIESVHQPADVVEAAVRDELAKWRGTARIQTFVPIFAERAVRRRLAS